MKELCIQVKVCKDGSEIKTSFTLLNEKDAQGFGVWQGLPETIHSLVQCALLLEARLQLLRSSEEGRKVTPDELKKGIASMVEAQVQLLLPQTITRCLSEMERIQGP